MSTHNYLDKTGLGQVWGKIKDLIPESELFLITITDGQDEGTYESDKTFLEIGEAITEGKDIKCIYWNNIYYLVYNNNDGFLQFQNRINIGVDDPQYSDINDIYFSIIQIDIFNNTIGVFQTRCEVPLPSITAPLMNGTASIGNSEKYAKADHVHPSDTTRAAVADVLTKTNTTSYTPTSDYHPATKKYVDDNVGSIDFSNYLAKNNTTSYTPTANYHPATKKYVDDKGLMVVTITSDTSGEVLAYTADKTFAEINSHISNGGTVVAKDEEDYYTMFSFGNTPDFGHVEFRTTMTDSIRTISMTYIIHEDNSVEYYYDGTPLILESTPSNGQILKFSSISNGWVNTDISLGLSNNTIQLKEGDQVVSSITLPVYNGGVSS